MSTLKNLFLTVLFTIGMVSTSFANKDTIKVSSPTQVYHTVGGVDYLVTSITVNVGDTLHVENWANITADFILNTTTVSGVCGTMCGFDYKVVVADAPSFVLKAVVMSNTVNLPMTVYVNNVTTGISENTNKVEFGVFPNPVVDYLTISFTKDLGKVTVTNLTGQVVFTDVVNTNKTNIDFTTFANGVYVVQVGVAKKMIKK